MKLLYKISFLATCLLLVATNLLAQWEPTDGPNGGDFYLVATTSSSIFTTNGALVFRSDNDGLNWQPASIGLPKQGFTSIVSNGDVVFIATKVGVYRSEDNGENWIPANTGLTDTNIGTLAVDESRLYVGTATGEVFFSVDNGESWNYIGTGLPDGEITAITFNGATLFVGIYGEGVYKTEDNGLTWNAVTTGLDNKHIYCLASNDNTIIAGTTTGLYRSDNNGENWKGNGGNIGGHRIYSAIAIKDFFFIGTSSWDAYRSDNDGVNWVQIPMIPTFNTVRFLNKKDSNLFAGTSTGIYKSSDYGMTWDFLSEHLSGSTVNFITKNWNYLIAGTFGRGVFRSNNNGDDWENLKLGNASTHAKIGADLYIGFVGFDVYRTNDFGNTWAHVGEDMGGKQISQVAAKSNKLYASTFTNGLYRLSKNEKKWEGEIFNANIGSIGVFGTKMFLGTWQGVFSSFDDGETWQSANAGLGNSVVLEFVFTNAAIFACTQDGLFRSTNDGLSWEPTNNGLTDIYITTGIVSGTEILIGTNNGNVFRSNDNGESWVNVSEGLIGLKINCFEFDEDEIFIGTSGGGIWRRKVSEVLLNPHISDPEEVIVENVYLGQNYPNPFKTSTRISLILPYSSAISIKVIDSNGVEVETLEDGKLAAGAYIYKWSPSGLSNGIYFFEVKVGKKCFAKKMILQK